MIIAPYDHRPSSTPRPTASDVRPALTPHHTIRPIPEAERLSFAGNPRKKQPSFLKKIGRFLVKPHTLIGITLGITATGVTAAEIKSHNPPPSIPTTEEMAPVAQSDFWSADNIRTATGLSIITFLSLGIVSATVTSISENRKNDVKSLYHSILLKAHERDLEPLTNAFDRELARAFKRQLKEDAYAFSLLIKRNYENDPDMRADLERLFTRNGKLMLPKGYEIQTLFEGLAFQLLSHDNQRPGTPSSPPLNELTLSKKAYALLTAANATGKMLEHLKTHQQTPLALEQLSDSLLHQADLIDTQLTQQVRHLHALNDEKQRLDGEISTRQERLAPLAMATHLGQDPVAHLKKATLEEEIQTLTEQRNALEKQLNFSQNAQLKVQADTVLLEESKPLSQLLDYIQDTQNHGNTQALHEILNATDHPDLRRHLLGLPEETTSAASVENTTPKTTQTQQDDLLLPHETQATQDTAKKQPPKKRTRKAASQ